MRDHGSRAPDDMKSIRLADVYDSALVEPSFQPIVDLVTERVVGYEALARWPSLPGVTPILAFESARRSNRVAELDWVCRTASLELALQAGLGDDVALFVNVEPSSLGAAPPATAQLVLARARRELRVVLELTERSLLDNPANLLAQVARARDDGWGIAMDDVGAHPDSLALLDLLTPDVVKLDLALVQESPARDQARTVAAVMAYGERTGALILAEGIETPAHLEQALALGATLGQGWAFGRPGPLPPVSTPLLNPIYFGTHPTGTARTPFDVVYRRRPVRIAPKHLLHVFSRHIEELVFHAADPPVILTALQEKRRFSGETERRYRRLARVAPLTAVFGRGIDTDPAPGVRGVPLQADDPLVREWVVVVLGSGTTAALVARDNHDRGPDRDRRFSFVITHDRAMVTEVARSLLTRVTHRLDGSHA